MSNEGQGSSQPPPEQKNQPQRARWPDVLTVEFGNDHQTVQVVINSKPIDGPVRGSFNKGRMGSRKHRASSSNNAYEEGTLLGMRTLSDATNRIPDMPGIRLVLDCQRRTAILFDPCEPGGDGEAAMKAYNVFAESKQFPGFDVAAPVRRREYKKLEDDQMKSILVELRNKLDGGMLSVVSGDLPSMEAIDKMAGREIYDPWNTDGPKPKYKDELGKWRESRERLASQF